MKAVIFTNTGPARSENEDAVLSGQLFCNISLVRPEAADINEVKGILAIADGMGGHAGGAKAAEMVLLALRSLDEQPLSEDAPHQVETKLKSAADDLRLKACDDQRLKGFGATVAGIWFDRTNALIFNCGDCRVYRFRSGLLDQLSYDHSRVFQLFREGLISEDDMRHHPLKHVVTSSIQDDAMPPDIFTRRIEILTRDLFLICSDGVWESLALEDIEECLCGDDLMTIANHLTEDLIKADCEDNLSFILCKFN